MSRSALYPGVSFAPPALLGAGRFVMQHPRPSGPLHQPTWLIEWLVDGVLEVAIDGADWRRFGPGAGMLYAPHTRYRERCPSGPSRSVVVLFDPGPDPAFDAVRTAGPYRLLEDPTGRATALTSEIVEALGLPGPRRLAAAGALLQLLAMLVAAASPELHWRLRADDGGDLDLVAATRRFMHANLHRPIRVADMARHAGLTVSGFAHAYRRLSGSSPMQDLRRLRIEAVKVHLLQNRMTLDQIARVTGFADGFHLSHRFRQATGQSPRDYRRQASR